MTPWYDPSQLLKTAVEVAVSTLLGRHADFRLVETLASPQATVYDYSDQDEFWIDYVADLGDGWDSTYAVAYYLAQKELKVGPASLQRGRILIFGGDQVYPTASRAAYQQKLIQPYSHALQGGVEPRPDLFAIPGNHDWYDSLASFTRLFCAGRTLAAWQTRQNRSYFALRLPRGWWLVGTDVQLESDIDGPQVAYFREVARQMQPGDRVILCNAEPHWLSAQEGAESNLKFLEEKVLGRKIAVFIAGDLHHYRRHEGPEKTQKITAGGGGAFLHPTHGPDARELPGEFKLQKCFPDERTSRRLCWRNLLFPVLNPYFGILTGALYVLTTWTVKIDISDADLGAALAATFPAALNRPAAVFWIVAIFLGFVLFTDTRWRAYRVVAGPLHAVAHLAAVFLLGWGATWLTVARWDLKFGDAAQLLAAGGLIFAGGWLVGPLVMGLYLLISLNAFRQHPNEAFSSLQIPDWKNFLRLRIDPQGKLTIYPIGIRKVPRWPALPPNAGTPPELIEQPIVIPGGAR
jgi:hypothetical protein